MPLIALSTAQARFRPGAPLPWDVLNGDGCVVWARGVVPRCADLVSLGLGRGLFLDVEEVLTSLESACHAEDFFQRWDAWELKLSILLRQHRRPDFLAKVRDAAQAMVALAAFDSDKLLFAIIRHDHSRFEAYGVSHSQHVAGIGALLAQNLGWAGPLREELACAALTMNLSILDLQGTLASQGGRLTAVQKVSVRRHPDDSAALLQGAGLAAGPWRDAVANHHERPDGSGYPRQNTDLDDLSRVLHLVDVFTAQHAARQDRLPVPVAQAVRALAQWPGPEAARLAAVMGSYPPGCFVRLTTGEVAVVLRRVLPGAPSLVLALLQDSQGRALRTPRTMSAPSCVVAHALPDGAVMMRLDPASLYETPKLARAA